MFGRYVVATLNVIRLVVVGECGTAFFLSEDYLTKGTDEETRVIRI